MRKEIFLDELPKRGKNINWKESIGHKVKFIYDDIEGEIEIIDYKSNGQELIVKYKDRIKSIKTGMFSYCNLGNITGKITSDFKIKIGTHFKDDKRDITIIDREIREVKKKDKKCKKGYTITKQKWYKYHCNIDGNEDWIVEGNLLIGNGCNVCSGVKVTEYNCMWNTHRELCERLGIPKEIAETVTSGSSIPITFPCKYCENIVTLMPYNIINNNSISCNCGNGKSYPEKFMFNVLKQVREYFIPEYSPDYLKGKRNDFYLPNYDIVIETDGILGHKGGKAYGKYKSLKESIEVDNWKEEQNLKHGIKTIRINCFESNLEYIKNNILKSELTEYIDFSNVDWNKCEEYALKNIVYEVCNYWHEHKEINKEDITTADLIKIFSLSRTTIVTYLNKGTKFNWCNYNGKEENARSMVKNNKLKSKIVLMYDKDMNFIGEYESASWLDRNSIELFGVNLDSRYISAVATGKNKQYKGFIFKYKECIDK